MQIVLPPELEDLVHKFIAPTTFPGVNTLEEYADDHTKIMQQVNNLHIVSFDVLFAKGDKVCIRYTAEGSHSGAPHGNISATGLKAQWTASGYSRWRMGSCPSSSRTVL